MKDTSRIFLKFLTLLIQAAEGRNFFLEKTSAELGQPLVIVCDTNRINHIHREDVCVMVLSLQKCPASKEYNCKTLANYGKRGAVPNPLQIVHHPEGWNYTMGGAETKLPNGSCLNFRTMKLTLRIARFQLQDSGLYLCWMMWYPDRHQRVVTAMITAADPRPSTLTTTTLFENTTLSRSSSLTSGYLVMLTSTLLGAYVRGLDLSPS